MVLELTNNVGTAKERDEWLWGQGQRLKPEAAACVSQRAPQYTVSLCPFRGWSKIAIRRVVNLARKGKLQDYPRAFTRVRIPAGRCCYFYFHTKTCVNILSLYQVKTTLKNQTDCESWETQQVEAMILRYVAGNVTINAQETKKFSQIGTSLQGSSLPCVNLDLEPIKLDPPRKPAQRAQCEAENASATLPPPLISQRHSTLTARESERHRPGPRVCKWEECSRSPAVTWSVNFTACDIYKFCGDWKNTRLGNKGKTLRKDLCWRRYPIGKT